MADVHPAEGGRGVDAGPGRARRWLRRLLLPGDSVAENALFLALILVGAAVRLLWLGEIPQGLNADEASAGYDAWALLEHGIDRHGYRYPVHLVAWGGGQNALYGYLAMPFIKLLGLNPLSFRLPQALLGVAALFVMYAVGRRLAGRGFALCALFVLAISPWHVMASRWGLESNVLPTVLLFAFALLLRGLSAPRCVVPAFLLLGLALYAYGTAYVFVPLFALGVLAYGIWRGQADLRHWGLGLVLMAAVALPIGLLVAINHFGLPAVETPLFSIPRYEGPPRWVRMFALFADDPIGRIAHNAWWTFKMLVLDGHDHYEYNALLEFGYFYRWAGLAVTLAGAGFLVRDLARGRRPESLLVLLWLAAGLVTSVLTAPNINRMNVLFLPLLLCAAYGLHGAFPRIRAWRRGGRGRAVGERWPRMAAHVLCVAAAAHLTLSFAAFTRHYFFNWEPRYHIWEHPSFAEALAHVIRRTDAHEAIAIVGDVSYTLLLFFDPPDPHLYLRTVDMKEKYASFQTPRSFGRYRFHKDPQAAVSGDALVIDNGQLPNYPTADFIVTRFDHWSAVLRRK